VFPLLGLGFSLKKVPQKVLFPFWKRGGFKKGFWGENLLYNLLGIHTGILLRFFKTRRG